MRPAVIVIFLLGTTAANAAPAQSKSTVQKPPPAAGRPEPAPVPPADPYGDAALQIRVDPHAGSFVGKEVSLGAAMVLATDVGCGLGAAVGALGIFVVTGNFFTSNEALVALIVDLVIFAILDAAISPLMGALGAYWAADKEGGNNGLVGALLGAYAAQAISLATGALLYLGGAALVAAILAGGGGSGAATIAGGAVAVFLGLIFAAVHYAGLPLGASFGIHWTGAVNKQKPAEPSDRKPAALPTRPVDFYAQVRRVDAVPLVAFRF